MFTGTLVSNLQCTFGTLNMHSLHERFTDITQVTSELANSLRANMDATLFHGSLHEMKSCFERKPSAMPNASMHLQGEWTARGRMFVEYHGEASTVYV